MQKSQQGLLQSLLHEVLRKCQDLTPRDCAEHLEHIRSFRYSHSEPWSRSDLSAAFQQLTKQELTSTKFCFCVDGLDEYDGDHEDIICILKTFANSPRIKVCTSSRAWNVFVDAFGQTHDRKLLLENLTKEDIRCYVKNQLDEYEKLVYIKDVNNCYRELCEEIVIKAQGVFLWVFLVVRSLRKGFKEADDITDLQRRLRLLPADPETYFHHIFNSIEECYREQSAQMFLIAIHAYHPLPVMTVAMLDRRVADSAQDMEITNLHQDDILALQKKTLRRINARCKDLLEFRANMRTGMSGMLIVQFIHRTAHHFLLTQDINKIIWSRVTSDFNPRIALCEAELIKLKSIHQDYVDIKDTVFNVCHYAREIENIDDFSVAKILDELDRVVAVVGPHHGFTWNEELSHDEVRHVSITLLHPGQPRPETNFIEFAIKEFLVLYVTQKLESKPTNILPLSSANRLLCSLCLFPRSEKFNKANFDMVSLLLKYGASPNERVFGAGDNKKEIPETLWAGFTQLIERTYYAADSARFKFDYTEIFLLHGADPHVEIVAADGGKMTALDVIRRIFTGPNCNTWSQL
ncbi:hypothetical protein MMC26_004728 [Xylographa opegraphella]|nr:hypothetical protein [Xylographa opegraphella]